MKLPTREKIRYHVSRWVWIPALALIAHVAFPSSAADVAPLLEPGARADKEIVAPFNFVVNKSEDELQREAEELAASAKPIYEFRQRAYDSTATTMSAVMMSAVTMTADRMTADRMTADTMIAIGVMSATAGTTTTGRRGSAAR